jgi:hypothetical protein
VTTREPPAAFDAHDSLLTIYLRCMDALYLGRNPQYIRLFRKVYDVNELQAGRRVEVRDPGGR